MPSSTVSIEQKALYLHVQAHYQNVLKILRRKVASGHKLRVGFCVIFSSVFPAKPLFEAMLQDDLFEPFIIVAPDIARSEEHMNETFHRTYTELAALYSTFVHKGYNQNTGRCVSFADKVDLIYFANPYKDMTHPIFDVVHFLDKNILTFHINYTFFGTLKYDRYIMTLPSYNYYWRVFTESPLLNELFQAHQPLRGHNTVPTGYCKMDALAKSKKITRTRKKIILAPHHTVGKADKSLQLSNFIKYAELFQALPKSYPQIDFVLRPHPLLIPTLSKPTVWGEAKTLEYFKQITENPNLEHDCSGDYLDLFANSDGIIHDCGSFLAEYLFTGKPALYLLKNQESIESTFDIIGQRCLEHCYHGFSSGDIVSFIDDIIIGEKDPLQEERHKFVTETLKENYPFVSKVILAYLKKELVK